MYIQMKVKPTRNKIFSKEVKIKLDLTILVLEKKIIKFYKQREIFLL